MDPEALKAVSTYQDNRIDILIEDNADRSLHAKAIHKNQPYTLLLDSKGNLSTAELLTIYTSLEEKLGKENIIILDKKINAPGSKLSKIPFYVLHRSFGEAIDLLQLKSHIAAQKDEKYTFIYVNPDLLGEAKTELGKLLP